jgi:Holliday junction resolvase-like predicted endonuclease
MAGSALPNIDYYFREERLRDEGGERTYARLVGDLTAARAGGLLCDFRVLEHAEAFPAQADESAVLKRLREFSMVKKIGLGRRFGSNKNHFSWFPSHALLVSVGSELRNVFPCELENRYVEPEDFLESLLKRESWAVGGVERRKRVRRHDRLADHLAANPNLLEPGLTFRGAEILVSSMSGEGGSIDLLFHDSGGRFLIVEVKVKPEELDKAVGQLRRHARLYVETFHIEAARLRLAVACPDILPARIAEFAEIGITCFPLPWNLLDTV